jgi:hypothetical protein
MKIKPGTLCTHTSITYPVGVERVCMFVKTEPAGFLLGEGKKFYVHHFLCDDGRLWEYLSPCEDPSNDSLILIRKIEL